MHVQCQLRVLTASGSNASMVWSNDRDKIKNFPNDNLSFTTEEPAINGQNFGTLAAQTRLSFFNETKLPEMPAKRRLVSQSTNQIEVQIEETGASRSKTTPNWCS